MIGRILCLDYGTVRIGVAVSDPTGTVTSSRPCIEWRAGNVFDAVNALVEHEECKELIVGLPISLNGQDTQKTVEVRRFVEELMKHIDIPIKFWDERLTSYEADQIMIETQVKRKKKKQKRDSLAAQIILRGYLDSL